MYTFLRIPKSGTTTIVESINKKYGDFPIKHATVDQLLEMQQGLQFFTMIRDPLQQYCSMYYHYKAMIDDPEYPANLYNARGNPKYDPDQLESVLKSNTLEEYLLNSPQNAFLGKFLCGLSPYSLICVGHVDHMDDTYKLFNKILDLPITPGWLRRNPNRKDNNPYTVDNSILEQFKKRNEVEYDLYAQSYEHFNKLRERYLD